MTTMTDIEDKQEAAMIDAEADAQHGDGTKDLQEGIARAHKLAKECVKFRLSISLFSSGKGFDAADKERVADSLGIQTRAVSGSKKLYDSNCEPIKNARSVLSAVTSLVDGMTIPLSHFRHGAGKDAGSRLLEISNADTLEEQLETHKLFVQAAEDRLNDERAVILEASRKMLTTNDRETGLEKTRFSLADYPEKFKLVMDWHIEPAVLPEYMGAIMPRAFKRAMAKAEATFEKTAQNSVEEFMGDFLGVVRHWSERLGPKVKIYPTGDHDMVPFFEAEIVERKTHETDPDIPEGKFTLHLVRAKKGSRPKMDQWTEPLSQAEYAELHPDEDTKDKKKFHTSTIQNLMDVIKQFRSVGSMLSAPASFTAVVDTISTHLAGMGNSEDVADELRNSRSYRAQTVALMSSLGDKLDSEIVEVKKLRRKITRIEE